MLKINPISRSYFGDFCIFYYAFGCGGDFSFSTFLLLCILAGTSMLFLLTFCWWFSFITFAWYLPAGWLTFPFDWLRFIFFSLKERFKLFFDADFLSLLSGFLLIAFFLSAGLMLFLTTLFFGDCLPALSTLLLLLLDLFLTSAALYCFLFAFDCFLIYANIRKINWIAFVVNRAKYVSEYLN